MTKAAQPKETLGLCSNCIHLATCTLRGDGTQPILFCEEHECFTPDEIREIVEEHDLALGGIISILESIQSKYGYLPRKALEAVAKETGRSLVDLYGVATFFRAFSLEPRGRHLVSVCLGTACHVRGSPDVLRAVEAELGVKAGSTTQDMEFSLETVNCLGACALGPIVVVDGHYFSQVKPADVPGIVERVRAGLNVIDVKTDQRLFPLTLSCPRCNHSLMDSRVQVDGLPGIRVTMSFGDKHGWMCLSCLYGSRNIVSEYEIPEQTLVHFFCPHCHTELIGSVPCPECGSAMVSMIVRGGGVVQICSRHGCPGHLLDL
ncbi:MAG: NAD(P)H-dependent oxidoreductase subunit E [Deltaproteobacteria bacterium]|nr:NAD(P)H-dependent oxidoreductase subunit E [Deltaproteobacteria bacterium]